MHAVEMHLLSPALMKANIVSLARAMVPVLDAFKKGSLDQWRGSYELVEIVTKGYQH